MDQTAEEDDRDAPEEDEEEELADRGWQRQEDYLDDENIKCAIFDARHNAPN